MKQATQNEAAEYAEAIAQAKANLEDFKKRGEAAVGVNVLELMRSHMTEEEIAASNQRVAEMIRRTQAARYDEERLAEA